MTVMASSLKDDDLMISASIVDPIESRSMLNKSRIDGEKSKVGSQKPPR